MEHPTGQVEDKQLQKILQETSGLGTPATRADIIEKLFSTFYIERHGKELVPTSKGIQLIGLVENYINSWISQRIVFDMKNQMYRHLQFMPHAFFTTEKQGDIITRMNSDVGGVASVISGTLTSAVSNFCIVVTTLIALFSMNWQLAIVGILVIPLLILPTRKAGRTRYNIASKTQEKRDELNEVVSETLSVSGSLLSKLFTREDIDYARFEKANAEVTAYSLK